jgi:hypothetical protein
VNEFVKLSVFGSIINFFASLSRFGFSLRMGYQLTKHKLDTMKNITQLKQGRVKLWGLLLMISTGMSACLKSDSDGTSIQQPTAALSVVNASPDSQPLDLYLDARKVDAPGISYGTGLNYFSVQTGKRTVSFNLVNTAQQVKSDTMTLNTDRAYTLYIANKIATPDYLLLRDTISRPAAGTASVRFVNVSADAPAVDLIVQGGNVLVANKAYKGYSSFVPVTGGTYTLQVRQTGTTNILATYNNVDMASGGVFTIWLEGTVSATTDAQKLKLDRQTNAYYYN